MRLPRHIEALAPCCSAAPITTSSISAGATPARFTASAMTWPPSAWRLGIVERAAIGRPIGVRAVETMTALRMGVYLLDV